MVEFNAQQSVAEVAQLRGMFRAASPVLESVGAPWSRLPEAPKHLVHPELAARAAQLSGVRVSFTTNSTEISGELESRAGVTVSLTGQGWSKSTRTRQDGSFEFKGLGVESEMVEVWMPHTAPSRLLNLSVNSGASVASPRTPGPRWVCYGSSISQGNHVSAPHLSWPAIASTSLNFDLRSLGFAGQAHVDAVVANDIRDGTADFISICAGINTHNSGTSMRSFWSNLSSFLETVRVGHPEIPIVLISPISSPSRERTPASPQVVPKALLRGARKLANGRIRSVIGPTLGEIREVVHEVGDTFVEASGGLIRVIDGRELLGPDDSHTLMDGLHPGAAGNRLIAERFSRYVASMLPQLDKEQTPR